jgi:pimeloyl-ACP methyl ester carboxylesterase
MWPKHASASKGVLGAVCRTFFSPTFDRMLGSYGAINVPLLIVWGREDSWHALEHGELLHRLLVE